MTHSARHILTPPPWFQSYGIIGGGDEASPSVTTSLPSPPSRARGVSRTATARWMLTLCGTLMTSSHSSHSSHRYRDGGNKIGEACALDNAAFAEAQLGEHGVAKQAFEQALASDNSSPSSASLLFFWLTREDTLMECTDPHDGGTE